MHMVLYLKEEMVKMCWSLIVEVCLPDIIIKERGEDKNDTERTRAKMRKGRPDDEHNQNRAV